MGKIIFPLLIIVSAIAFTSCKKDGFIKEEKPEDTIEGPPGHNFLYSSNSSGKFEIWEKKDGVETMLTSDDNYESWWPRLSPDGSRILFYRSTIAGNISDYSKAELWVMDRDGGNSKVLLERGANNWAQHGFANWSPDGKKIILAANTENENWQLYTIGSQGENPQKVSSGPGSYLDPVYSPDGKKIACAISRDDSNENTDIFVISSENGEERQITDGPNIEKSPAWSGDGNTIAFEKQTDPNYLSIGKWAISTFDLTTEEAVDNAIGGNEINLLPRFCPRTDVLYFGRLDLNSFNFMVFSKQLPDGTVSAETTEEQNSFGADPF